MLHPEAQQSSRSAVAAGRARRAGDVITGGTCSALRCQRALAGEQHRAMMTIVDALHASAVLGAERVS